MIWMIRSSLHGVGVGLVVMAVACGPEPGDRERLPQPGVTRDLAERRASMITDVRYEVTLAIPSERAQPIAGTVTTRFDLASTGETVVFDFAQSPEHVLAVRRGDEAIAYEVGNEHLTVARGVLEPGPQAVTIDFVAGDGSLNRNDDYLYTLFVPDRARVALPLFDQPDLKARFTLTLEVPADWQAIANGALSEHTIEGDRATFVFDESDPIPTYLLAFAAGRFEVVEAEREGRTLRLLHRETDSEKVARNLDTIFDLHATALSWLEDYTGIGLSISEVRVRRHAGVSVRRHGAPGRHLLPGAQPVSGRNRNPGPAAGPRQRDRSRDRATCGSETWSPWSGSTTCG